jgi:hypothetical protein
MVNPSVIDVEPGMRKTMRARGEQNDPRREYAFQENLGRRME